MSETLNIEWFISALQHAGWRAPLDAQHDQAAALWARITETHNRERANLIKERDGYRYAHVCAEADCETVKERWKKTEAERDEALAAKERYRLENKELLKSLSGSGFTREMDFLRSQLTAMTADRNRFRSQAGELHRRLNEMIAAKELAERRVEDVMCIQMANYGNASATHMALLDWAKLINAEATNKPQETPALTIKIVCTFTESPSFNVRLLHNGLTFFYNSERLQGNERIQKVGKILGITTLSVGEHEMQITQEQYNAICDVEVGREQGKETV
jgi:hypothetical protein